MDFRTFDIEDKKIFEEYYKYNTSKSCISCFGTVFAWNKAYPNEYAIYEGFLIFRYENEGDISYTYPIGHGDINKVILAIEEDAKKMNKPYKINNANEDEVKYINEAFPGKFEYDYDRDYADYIYTSEKLGYLKGKKLHSKRNHINKFKTLYEGRFSYEEITQDNISQCLEMNKEWCEINNCNANLELKEEACAVKRFLKYYKELNLRGMLLKVDDKVVAFTFGEPVNDKTFVVHVEKALYDYHGAYPMINNLFVSNMLMDYEYINREEDTGDEGLRKAKLSYKPDIIYPRCTLTPVL